MPTAIIKVSNDVACDFLARALIDQCSQASFISRSLLRKLRIPKKSTYLPISGVGGSSELACTQLVNFDVKPNFYSDFVLNIDAFVIPKTTSYSPNVNFEVKDLTYLSGLPTF